MILKKIFSNLTLLILGLAVVVAFFHFYDQQRTGSETEGLIPTPIDVNGYDPAAGPGDNEPTASSPEDSGDNLTTGDDTLLDNGQNEAETTGLTGSGSQADQAANASEQPASGGSTGNEPVQNSTATKTAPAAAEDVPVPHPLYKTAFTTVFWAGEAADEDNAFISNTESYWDGNWLGDFGGIDSPDRRCGYRPCAFLPKENPFYFALPYGEFDANGGLKASARGIPWYHEPAENESLLKNHWIEVKYGNKICYAQWEDVGPFEEDDFDYVFGTALPANTEGAGAGLDLSPAAWDCLGLPDNDYTLWRFVDASAVPDGPWKVIVTSSGINY